MISGTGENALGCQKMIKDSRPTFGNFSNYRDDRGVWSRVFDSEIFREILPEVAQTSVSITDSALTLRGLHSMGPTAGEWKLVTCVKGRVWDVSVNVDRESPLFCNYEGRELNGATSDWVLIPPSYAHGFISLTDDATLCYVMTAPYDARLEIGFRYDEPMFNIAWPAQPRLISEKDLSFGFL